MKSNWLKKIINLLLIIIMLVILFAPFVYIHNTHPDESFWDNAMGNMFATVLALVAGIPSALWIDRLIKSQERQSKYAQDRKREYEILKLVEEELDFNLNSVFRNGKKGNKDSLTIKPMKSDLWDALIASEQIKFIEDSKLLYKVTSAYYVLKFVNKIEEQAYISLRTLAVHITYKDGSKKNPSEILINDARGFDDLLEKSMEEALKMVRTKLQEII